MRKHEMLIAFVEDWLRSNNIPIHHITMPCEDYAWVDFGLRKEFPNHQGYDSIKNFLEDVEQETVYHLTDTFGCSYCIFQLPDSEALAVYGPVMFANGSHENTINGFRVFPELVPSIQDFYLRVPFVRYPMAYYNVFQTLGKHIWGVDSCRVVSRDLSDFGYWKDLFQQYIRSDEASLTKAETIMEWYALETELFNTLSSGTESDMLEIASKMHGFTFLHQHTDRIREIKNRLLMMDTLLRKTAESLGIHPVQLEIYLNRHVQLIEQLKSETEGSLFLIKIIQDYYDLVHRQSIKNYSSLTQKIMTLINSNLSDDLSLNTISEKVNANANYISTLFKKEVGVTLTEYVSQKRADLAKRLLISTDLPIKVIASKCGIADIPYFNRQFKKRVGCTPKSFREKTLKTADFFQY